MNRDLIPSSLDLTPEQRELMLQINKLIGDLFEQGEVLRPSVELNGERWHYLQAIADNPERIVSYSVSQHEIVYVSHIWLNLYLSVGVYNTDGAWYMTRLTPKQTFWIARQLQDNGLLVSKMRAVAERQVEKLHQSAEEIRVLLENNEIFALGDRKNKIFDTNLKDDLYTNRAVRV